MVRTRCSSIERLQFSDDTSLGIIVGTAAGETLNGTAGDDLILGLGGNDTLNGLGGNDILVGGPGTDTLNGGLGDDTYSFSLGDGSDTINEGVSATSGGSATGSRSCRRPPTRCRTRHDWTQCFRQQHRHQQWQPRDQLSTASTITVNGHFTGTNLQTGVERINFNNATFAGYLLGAEDYLISRADPGNRDAGGVNLSASIVNNFLVGEQGVADDITGGSGNDLIFGGTGDNDLFGGLGDDLLVGGWRLATMTSSTAASMLDTMIGGLGNDIYVVDDIGDVVVEAAERCRHRHSPDPDGRALDRTDRQRGKSDLHRHRCRSVRRHRQRPQQRHHRRRPRRHAERPRRQRHAQWRARRRHADRWPRHRYPRRRGGRRYHGRRRRQRRLLRRRCRRYRGRKRCRVDRR